tara:strand:+ start:233 stop:487 length:255 start_codon:yes stop_codon:yes gene_type:complete
MTTQPETLRLVDELVLHAHYAMNGEAFSSAIAAATELRRLHEVNQELLAALKYLLADAEDCGGYSPEIHNIARASIAKAEGEQA